MKPSIIKGNQTQTWHECSTVTTLVAWATNRRTERLQRTLQATPKVIPIQVEKSTVQEIAEQFLQTGGAGRHLEAAFLLKLLETLPKKPGGEGRPRSLQSRRELTLAVILWEQNFPADTPRDRRALWTAAEVYFDSQKSGKWGMPRNPEQEPRGRQGTSAGRGLEMVIGVRTLLPNNNRTTELNIPLSTWSRDALAPGAMAT